MTACWTGGSRVMLPPPEPFTTPVVVCPSCDHGIDPHGLDPGGYCGVGMWNDSLGINVTCMCLWQPNDIAATLLADERERIAQAIEALGTSMPKGARTHDYYVGLHEAARIARDGGRDE